MGASVPPVEDDPEIRLLLEHQLKGSCEVTFGSPADEPLRPAETEDFDLLLLDINLGGEKSRTELHYAICS